MSQWMNCWVLTVLSVNFSPRLNERSQKRELRGIMSGTQADHFSRNANVFR